MRVEEKTENRLVLTDSQLDKKIAVSAIAGMLLLVAFEFARGGDWIEAAILVALAAGALIYLKLTLLNSVITFDRAADQVTLVVTSRTRQDEWHWKLSDVKAAEVSETRRGGQSRGNGQKRPVLVLQDDTRVPLRPYRSAGSQSWEAVIAIRRFIGQDKTDDLPVGWIHDD